MTTDTAYIPRAADLATEPIPRVDMPCAWCKVRIGAVPDTPTYFEKQWYHTTGCYPAARMVHYGQLPRSYRPIGEL